MRVPLPWLREYCYPHDLDVAGIEERLTMTGTKVEAIHRQGVPSGKNFVVGRVLGAEPHPDADRLQVCQVAVDADGGQPATIVCGAPNVAAGQTVAVARPGAVMPDGTKIKRSKLRGVVSEGMILSAGELDLSPPTPADGDEGIMVLNELMPEVEWAPGTPLADVLPISQEVIELEVTPNRPDCLAVCGVARELHAATGAALAPAPWAKDPGSAGAVAGASVAVECPDLCPRFTARVFENVTVAPSPLWLKARLVAAGQRPINNVVDITNYGMLLTGQPMHAFDLDRVAGARLTVRRATDGEQVQTLDGQTRTLDSEMIVIDDAQGPTSIAGLMGGARSEVAPDTRRVLLEAATWSGPSIHRASWALGLRSEASSRFEKGLAAEQCMHAQAVASALMIRLCGAKLAPGTIDVGGEGVWAPTPLQVIRLREARVRSILGVPVALARQAEILNALDFATQPAEDGLDVTVPALRRQDVTREVDLIEEVARIDGLERLPATLPARRGAAGMLTHAQRVRRTAEDAMVARGLHEIVGWSFADPNLLDRLLLPADNQLRRVVKLENPLSDAQSIMRPTLLGSLLDAAHHNVARNGPDVAIFESGTVYRAPDGAHTGTPPRGRQAGERPADEDEMSADGMPAGPGAVHEHHALGVLLSGCLTPRSWRGEQIHADFFAAKALLDALLDHLHVRWWVSPTELPFLHPGRGAAVFAYDARGATGPERGDAGEPLALGLLGEVHPLVAESWGLERTAAFLLDLGKVAAAAPEMSSFAPFAAFPVLRQDLAFTLPVGVSAAQVLVSVREAGGEMLHRVDIFDVYSGEQVGEGRRSLALALSFRALDRTLTDEDVSPLRERIVAALAQLGGGLRG
jgi:phenylalanyl-tRNA synthetase beta chain